MSLSIHLSIDQSRYPSIYFVEYMNLSMCMLTVVLEAVEHDSNDCVFMSMLCIYVNSQPTLSHTRHTHRTAHARTHLHVH